MHGSAAHKALAPASRFHKGKFGRMFRQTTAWSPPGVSPDQMHGHFLDFANQNMVERPNKSPADLTDDSNVDALERDFGSQGTPAGYTYFGQFVDHDMTFDPTPLGVQGGDPNGLDNFRTPRLDLDCVYGNGPADQPYLYDKNASTFVLGKIKVEATNDDGNRILVESAFDDLPRTANGTAIIGDKRNDENAIVSQVQLAFLKAHNTLVNAGASFEEARQKLTWLYQWVVWHDFLQRITVPQVWQEALQFVEHASGGGEWGASDESKYSWRDTPFIPVEFAVAAYRFGHSMVRNAYQTNFPNNALDRVPLFNNVTSGVEDDLRGFQPRTVKSMVQWDWFLKMETSGGPFPQMARKIDTKLSNALAALPEKDKEPGHIDNKLAARNLIRGVDMGLPSGTAAAQELGLTPLTAAELDGPDALWFYILREAELTQEGERLGVLGSRIVLDVFAGLLLGDPRSWVRASPRWTPATEPLFQGSSLNLDRDGSSWGLPAIIRLAGVPVAASDF